MYDRFGDEGVKEAEAVNAAGEFSQYSHYLYALLAKTRTGFKKEGYKHANFLSHDTLNQNKTIYRHIRSA